MHQCNKHLLNLRTSSTCRLVVHWLAINSVPQNSVSTQFQLNAARSSIPTDCCPILPRTFFGLKGGEYTNNSPIIINCVESPLTTPSAGRSSRSCLAAVPCNSPQAGTKEQNRARHVYVCSCCMQFMSVGIVSHYIIPCPTGTTPSVHTSSHSADFLRS